MTGEDNTFFPQQFAVCQSAYSFFYAHMRKRKRRQIFMMRLKVWIVLMALCLLLSACGNTVVSSQQEISASEDSVSSAAVSYTHLDVYKRQLFGEAFFEAREYQV